MKNTLFGQLGDKLKGNGLVRVLMLGVVAAGVFSYTTINRINSQLENQRLQQIEATPQPQPTEQVQDVQTEQNNVPLPNNAAKPKPTPTPDPEEEDVAAQQTKQAFVLPVTGKIYSAFSGEELVYNRTLDDWRTHNGVDITAKKGDGVHAGADGIVKNIYNDGLLGTVVEIEHDGFTARYCGLAEKTFVRIGDSVTQSQSIGTVDEITMEVAEEPHIHLEIIRDGSAVNPDTVLK